MPKPPVPASLHDFLAQPNPSVIGSVEPDGSPHTAATWYVWDDGRVLVNMDATRKRLENMRNEPRVALTIMGSGDDWYRQITIRGRIAELTDDDDLSGIDRLCIHYMGQPYSARDQKRVNAWIDVEWWYGWNGGRPWLG